MDSNSIYRSVFPQVQKSQYDPGNTVDFLLSFQGLALEPNSVSLAGELVCRNKDKADVLDTDQVYFNERVGAHALFTQINTEMNALGVTETFFDYPSYISTTRLASELPLERGTSSPSSIELRVPTATNTRALCISAKQNNPLSFVVKPQIAVNKFNQALNYETSVEIRIRLRLAENQRFLYSGKGEEASYYLKNLKLCYRVTPPITYQGPLTTEIIQSDRRSLESTSSSINILIPTGLTNSFVGRCFKKSHENDLSKDKLACEVVPGIIPNSGNIESDSYGFNRIIYSINDLDSAPLNFNLESREEIIINYLRALRSNWKYKYSYLLNNLNGGGKSDSYAIGVNFGGLMDFTKQSFAMELNSAILSTEPYFLYLHTRSLVEIPTDMNKPKKE